MELIDKKISKIHNYIYANEGLSNSEVLNEFLKIFYCKILDEQEKNELVKSLSPDVIIKKVNALYEILKDRLKGIIDSKEKINLKKETIVYAIEELKEVKFKSVTSDVKGHILQKIIDRSYRESRGQFFTPAPVVDFMVKMINPCKGEKGCDPASGTGGFMFTALEHISENNNITKKDIDNTTILNYVPSEIFTENTKNENVKTSNIFTKIASTVKSEDIDGVLDAMERKNITKTYTNANKIGDAAGVDFSKTEFKKALEERKA